MGTERSQYHHQKCYCGRGEFIVLHCEPDHGWSPGEKWYETLINCDDCRQKFSLMEQDKQIVIVQHSDIQKADDLKKAYFEQSKSFIKSDEIQNYLNELEYLLSLQKNATAAHRILYEARIVDVTVGTFRKEFKQGISQWIHANIRFRNIKEVLQLLGKNDKHLQEKIAHIEALWAKGTAPFPSFGDPICNLR